MDDREKSNKAKVMALFTILGGVDEQNRSEVIGQIRRWAEESLVNLEPLAVSNQWTPGTVGRGARLLRGLSDEEALDSSLKEKDYQSAAAVCAESADWEQLYRFFSLTHSPQDLNKFIEKLIDYEPSDKSFCQSLLSCACKAVEDPNVDQFIILNLLVDSSGPFILHLPEMRGRLSEKQVAAFIVACCLDLKFQPQNLVSILQKFLGRYVDCPDYRFEGFFSWIYGGGLLTKKVVLALVEKLDKEVLLSGLGILIRTADAVDVAGILAGKNPIPPQKLAIIFSHLYSPIFLESIAQLLDSRRSDLPHLLPVIEGLGKISDRGALHDFCLARIQFHNHSALLVAIMKLMFLTGAKLTWGDQITLIREVAEDDWPRVFKVLEPSLAQEDFWNEYFQVLPVLPQDRLRHLANNIPGETFPVIIDRSRGEKPERKAAAQLIATLNGEELSKALKAVMA